MECKFCGKNCFNNRSLINHQRMCKSNPDSELTKNKMTVNRKKGLIKSEECEYCNKKFTKANIKRHVNSCKMNPVNQKPCPVCGEMFSKKSLTCGHSCSNIYFRHGRKGGCRYIQDDELLKTERYRDICFRWHEKKCIICGEENIVEAHHYNKKHSDHRAENLIPLCPTHHKYMHSSFKRLINDKVKEYIKAFKLNYKSGCNWV